MEMPVATRIALSEATASAEAVQDQGVEAMVRAAMKATYRHWMQTDESEQFRAAVGGVMLCTEGEDRERLEAEMRALNAFAAMVNGIPVDLERIPTCDNPIGLRRLWDEVTA